MGKIDDRKRMELIKSYGYRLKAAGISFDYRSLKKVFMLLSQEEINESFIALTKDKDNIIFNLNKLGIKATDRRINNNDLTDKIKKQLNLSDVTEFKNNDKDYFKFKDIAGQIYVVRNLGDDSKELFMNILNTTSIENENGKKNANEIFKLLNKNKFIEVNVHDSDKMESNKYSAAKLELLHRVEREFPQQKVVVVPDEDMFIVKGKVDGVDDDLVLSIVMEDNKYKLVPVNQKTYSKKDNQIDDPEMNDANKNIELPNDFIIEIENDQEINDLIENGLNENIGDEAIQEEATSTLQARGGRFANISVATIIANMIRRRREERQNVNTKGRQYVLSSNTSFNNAA